MTDRNDEESVRRFSAAMGPLDSYRARAFSGAVRVRTSTRPSKSRMSASPPMTT
ncbi:MAG: hypothetical protein AB7P00_41295 [Sandaracinaceae bacterium]